MLTIVQQNIIKIIQIIHANNVMENVKIVMDLMTAIVMNVIKINAIITNNV